MTGQSGQADLLISKSIIYTRMQAHAINQFDMLGWHVDTVHRSAHIDLIDVALQSNALIRNE